MSKHLDTSAGSRRRPVWILFGVIVAVVVVVCVVLMVHHGTAVENVSSSAQDTSTTGDATVVPITDDGSAGTASLPFTVEGAPSDATVLDVSEGTTTATLGGEWMFGGDYAEIGSFPVDATTVFGSCTQNPDDLTSYTAALIHPDGATSIEGVQTGETVYEPQDGTGDQNEVVWRSSILSLVPTTGTDDWRLQAWDASTGAVTTLGSARDLNGEADTPLLDGEIVPTKNDTNAYFASWHLDDGAWTPAVLSYTLDGSSGTPAVIGQGSYPAATDTGALYAGSPDTSASTVLYGSLLAWDGSTSSTVFTVTSGEGNWGISGVWACGDRRAVCFSSDNADNGCYVGIWDGSFSTNSTWLHVASPSIVASMNESWLVWGSGSQSDNAGMYAYDFGSTAVKYLGSALGYSRPTIASESNTVLVPESDGQSAVTFHVGTLS